MKGDPVQIDSIAVVGGGDIGLLHALALNKGTEADVVVIDDFEESVPEVGKSTLFNVVRLIRDALEIDVYRLVREVKLSWKTSVYLKDWCGVDPFHSPLSSEIPVVNQEGDAGPAHLSPEFERAYQEYYYRYRENNFSDIYTELAERPGTTPFTVTTDGEARELPQISYQFNSRSFNRFLRTICRERGVELLNDRITAVETAGNAIESISGESDQYTADLYVDASGFQRVLMEALENPLVEFDLPVDSAVVSTVDISPSEITSATVVTTGEAGWFWQIDTGGDPVANRDLGYVYSSSHLSTEAAEREFIDTRSEAIDPDDIRRYQFNSGVLEQPWVNNCVAAGNALGFVEPLQSTALSAGCLLAMRLTRLLSKHARVNHAEARRFFNETTRATWQEIYEFISIYYKYNSGSTPFWEDARSIDPGEIDLYRSYQEFGFSAWQDLDHLERSAVAMNEPILYHLIFQGLGVESEFYENQEYTVDPAVVEQVDEHTATLSDRVDQFLTYEEFYHGFHPGFE